ncbi:hypothetical protein ACP275_09G042100 [Erythranthe tilingii]
MYSFIPYVRTTGCRRNRMPNMCERLHFDPKSCMATTFAFPSFAARKNERPFCERLESDSWLRSSTMFNGSDVPSNVKLRMPVEADVSSGIDRYRICERLSTASPEMKQGCSFERLVNGNMRHGPFEKPQNGNTGNEHICGLLPPSSAISIPVAQKVCSRNGMDLSGDTHMRNGKGRGDGRVRDQLLLRYRPQIAGEEVQPGENLLVIHEELGGDPTTISFVTRKGQRICSHVSDSDLPPVDTWEPSVGFGSTTPQLGLKCETGWRIASVLFASFGTPRGNCGASFYPGICHANVSSTVEQMCGGKQGCSIPVSTATLGVGDPCPNVRKSLAVEILCQN